MSLHIAADDISTAWTAALAATNAEAGGTMTHLMVTVTHPDLGDTPAVTAAVNETLRDRRKQPVTTVANTLFPAALYDAPGFSWSPDLPATEVAKLDASAANLYTNYLDMLPDLRRVTANNRGTYFSRMISWPGKTGTGTNQLKERVDFLRTQHSRHQRTSNVSDISVAGEADGVVGAGLEEYAVTDRRPRGFPCLVHIDISVRNGCLSVLGVYRHWHLITRGYGNLIGLARLQDFLCQQTGFTVGELAVVAGHANAEHVDYSGRTGVTALLLAIDAIRAARAETDPVLA